MKFQRQRIQIPIGHTRNEDGTVTAEFEDRLVTTPEELQEAIKQINQFQKDTESAKINNATKVIDEWGAKVPTTGRLHANEIGKDRKKQIAQNKGTILDPYK
jgi:hypothetical protein